MFLSVGIGPYMTRKLTGSFATTNQSYQTALTATGSGVLSEFSIANSAGYYSAVKITADGVLVFWGRTGASAVSYYPSSDLILGATQDGGTTELGSTLSMYCNPGAYPIYFKSTLLVEVQSPNAASVATFKYGYSLA